MKNPLVIQAFAENLKRLIKEKGLSYNEVAIEADLTKAAIVRIANGRANVTLDNIISISDALGVHPKELLEFQLPVSD